MRLEDVDVSRSIAELIDLSGRVALVTGAVKRFDRVDVLAGRGER